MNLIFSSAKQPFVNGPDVCSELAMYLAQNKRDFEQQLIPDLTYIDHMAHNVNGIDVERVEYIASQQYQLYYTFEWEVFHGCSDKHEVGTQHEKVTLTLHSDGRLAIDFPQYHERDTTNEF